MKTSGNRVQSTAQAPHGGQRAGDSTEDLLDQLFVWLDNSMVRQAGGELARECHIALWEATSEKAREMTRDEARGYIRAYAPEFLVREVDLVLQRRRVRESLRRRILAEATEQVVELVLKDVHRAKSRRPASRGVISAFRDSPPPPTAAADPCRRSRGDKRKGARFRNVDRRSDCRLAQRRRKVLRVRVGDDG